MKQGVNSKIFEQPYQPPKSNYAAVAPPTVNDDASAGYSRRSEWYDTIAGEIYKCFDSTPGAAIWLNTSLTLDDLSAVAVTGDYNDLSGLPALSAVALSNDYDDLDNLPVLATVATSGDYADLSGLPALSAVALSNDYNDLDNLPVPGEFVTITASADVSFDTDGFFFDQSTGYVGIGTSSPSEILTIQLDAAVGNTFLRLEEDGSAPGTEVGIDFYQRDIGAGALDEAGRIYTQRQGAAAIYDLVFKVNGSESFRVDNNQRVGIGTTSPDEKLEVVGNVLADAFIVNGGTADDFLLADGTLTSLATVATSGAYSDLSGTPALSAVALSNDYDDLDNLPSLQSGTYAPTLTGDTNVDTVSLIEDQPFFYSRVGSVVSVFGWITVTASAGGAGDLFITLPIASNLANARDLVGMAVAKNGSTEVVARIGGLVSSDRAGFDFTLPNTTPTAYHLQFSYKVL